LSAHLVDCADCTAFVRRGERLQAACSGLDRLPVPAELPGRVVAACHAGFLQERAASALQALGRVPAPAELDAKVLDDGRGRLHAPPVLGRLVDEDLRDPSKALTRRFAGRLLRLPAPDELRERVARDLAGLGPADAPVARAAERRRAMLLVTVGLVASIGLALGVWFGASDAQAAPQVVFHVQRVTRADELDPIARELIGALSGGLSDLAVEGEPR
jgi:hypothetical protein